jgi:integrase
MLELGLKPRTVCFHHAVIHRALKTAARNGFVPYNIADSADPPGYREEEMTTWSIEELNKFLSNVQSHTLYALFYLALFTGMRRSELLGLQWRDIDFPNAQISVKRALHHLRDGSYIFTQPKTEKSRRSIALSPSTIAVLESHRKAQDGQEKAGGDRLVFLFRGNDHLNPNTVTWEWKKACIAAGVRPIRLHDGRHTHASLMLAQGVHPKIVQERLGHSSIQITLDTYSHVVPGLQEAAAVKFDTLIKT